MKEDLLRGVYILRCSDGSLYTGWAMDVLARLEVHKSGKGAKYTRARKDSLEIVYFEPASGPSEALKREAAIKKMTHSQKERLIESEENKISIIK